MLFKDFAIDPRCLSVLKSQKIIEPTPVQEAAIPIALDGKDLVAIAQTGTGKTLAFSLPTLSNLGQQHKERNAMLVITPTRELALQVEAVIDPIARALKMRAVCLYGGAGMQQQTRALQQGVQIIVATPGRLLDHMARGNVNFHNLKVLVLDEADRMLDMGFLPDIQRIVRKLPKDRQTLMFSATFPNNIERMARDMQRNPERVEIGQIASPVDAVNQAVYTVSHSGKQNLLIDLLNEVQVESALVFTRTKRRTDRVFRALHKAGYKAQAIHGDRTQQQRQKALEGFKAGRYKILVATDVAARGIDVQGITHVINYDIPQNSDDYIHRIGRTARANAKGDAITFVSPEDNMALGAIEQSLGDNIPRKDWKGAVPIVTIFQPNAKKTRGRRPAPRRRRRLLR